MASLLTSKSDEQQIGVGATEQLNLRVSVASLIKLILINAGDGRRMLALERTATLRENQQKTEIMVKAKPFGGVVRLANQQAFNNSIGDFHYDSQRSRQEADLRIYINPASWNSVKKLCKEHALNPQIGILDYSPGRELAEEFKDTLQLGINQDQYQVKFEAMVVEDQPVRTENVRSPGSMTTRIYYIFKARIENNELISSLLANNQRYTDRDLRDLAFLDAQQGGGGRANAVLVLPFAELVKFYRSFPMKIRSGPLQFEKHPLAENVLALMTEVHQNRYKIFIS